MTTTSNRKNLLSFLMALFLATGLVFSAGCAARPEADTKAASTEESTQAEAGAEKAAEAFNITLGVIGPDAEGNPVAYVATSDFAIAKDETAWDATKAALSEAGLEYDASSTSYGAMLNSITSPVDGTVLAFDEASGKYWQLFVNGVASEVGIDSIAREEGSEVIWYYSAFGDELPTGEVKPFEK